MNTFKEHIDPNEIGPSDKAQKALFIWLVIILAIRISTYFMVSESVVITRIYKFGGRILITILTFYLPYLVKELRIHPDFTKVRQLLPPLFYGVYLWLGAASLAWTSSFEVSFLQLFMDIETMVFAFAFMKMCLYLPHEDEGSAITFARVLWIGAFINVLGILIGSIVNPDTFMRSTHGGNVSRLGGFFINPNELGMLIVVGLAGLGMDISHQKPTYAKAFIGIILLYSLFLTSSRSSMISFVLLSGYYLLKYGKKEIIIAAIMLGIFIGPFVFNEVFLKEGDVEEVSNMTGRLPFWEDLIVYNVPRKPLLGYGFMRIDELDKFAAVHSYAGAMPHNTFLQVLLNLGLLGISIILIQMALTIRGIFKLRLSNSVLPILFFAMLIPLIINSLTEFGIWGETNYGIMFYLFIIWGVGLQRKRIYGQ
ncbi:MAG: O-antigen ligase family protein [Bacteroidota bacterium]